MKKVLLVALLAIGVSAVSYAQGGPGGGGMRGGGTPEQQLERFKTQITGITADQEAKLKVIYAAQTKSMDSLRTALGDDMQSYFTKMQPVQNKYNAQIKAVLNAEQAKAYQKVLDERAERMKQFMPQN
jgi:periplasmic protein CpxP/Spy